MRSERFVHKGFTLRLFFTETEAVSLPGLRSATKYAGGWLAKDESGRWVDAMGTLPESWTPDAALLTPAPGLVAVPGLAQ